MVFIGLPKLANEKPETTVRGITYHTPYVKTIRVGRPATLIWPQMLPECKTPANQPMTPLDTDSPQHISKVYKHDTAISFYLQCCSLERDSSPKSAILCREFCLPFCVRHSNMSLSRPLHAICIPYTPTGMSNGEEVRGHSWHKLVWS